MPEPDDSSFGFFFNVFVCELNREEGVFFVFCEQSSLIQHTGSLLSCIQITLLLKISFSFTCACVCLCVLVSVCRLCVVIFGGWRMALDFPGGMRCPMWVLAFTHLSWTRVTNALSNGCICPAVMHSHGCQNCTTLCHSKI